MTAKTLEEEASLYAFSISGGTVTREAAKTYSIAKNGYLAAATLRDKEIEELRARVKAAKSAIRWMHGYDEPGTEDFPICPEGKRFAWRIVARQQFSIVREACEEVVPPIPLPGERP